MTNKDKTLNSKLKIEEHDTQKNWRSA
jgi:hypothetical protein